MPFLFERLRENYGSNSRFKFENVAIAEKSGKLPFYYVRAEAAVEIPEIPEWHDQLGSFKRAHIINHLGEAITPSLRRTVEKRW